MENKISCIGVGYPSLDYIIPLNEEPRNGQTSLIISDKSEEPYFGGCVVNIIYLLNTFGYEAGISMSVGRNFEESGFKDFLIDGNVKMDYIVENSDYNTSFTKMIMSPNGEHMTLFYPGAMRSETYQENKFDDLACDYGLLAIGEPLENQEFLNECIKKKIPTIFSMKGDYHSLNQEYLTQAIEHSELIFMNETEFKQLNNYLPKTLMEYQEEYSDKIIVVTLGKDGSIILTNEKNYFIPAYDKAEVIDTSGGGDAFIGGFLSEYFKDKDLVEAGKTGTVLASYIIEDYGCLSNIPTSEELLNRKEMIKEREINDRQTNTLLGIDA